MSESATIHSDVLPLTVESLAEQFAACGLVVERLMKQRPLVDFAVEWIKSNRK